MMLICGHAARQAWLSSSSSSPQMALHSQLEVEAKVGDGGGLVKKGGGAPLSEQINKVPPRYAATGGDQARRR